MKDMDNKEEITIPIIEDQSISTIIVILSTIIIITTNTPHSVTSAPPIITPSHSAPLKSTTAPQ